MPSPATYNFELPRTSYRRWRDLPSIGGGPDAGERALHSRQSLPLSRLGLSRLPLAGHLLCFGDLCGGHATF